MPLDLQCTNEEKILVTVNPVTSGGKPASLDGPVRVTPTGTGTVEMVSDVSFFVVSGDDPSATTYLVEGDADLGEGIILLQDSINLNVSSANASNLGLTVATPVLK